MKNVNILLQDSKDVLDDLNIPYGKILHVVVNNRATGRWGRCTSRGNCCYILEISSRLLEDDITWENALNTMIHELLHAYPGRMCHTGEWKKCAERVNKEYYPLYNIKRTASAAEMGISRNEMLSEYKYTICCEGCGNKSFYKKKTKAVQYLYNNPNNSRYYCSTCHSYNLSVRVLDN